MRTIQDICYADYAACKLDLYIPDCAEFPVMVYYHGGGLEWSDKREDREVCEKLADSGIAVASADYRMYPDAKYPDFIEDAAAAVKWVRDHIDGYGKCEGTFIAGTSAGAYLSMMLCFDKKYLKKHGIDSGEITGYVFNSAQPTTHFNVLRERGKDTRSVVIDEAAPIYHIAENPNAAPMLILVSDNDIPNRLEQTNLFCNTLRQFGYDDNKIVFKLMKGYEHCSYNHGIDDDGNNIFASIIKDFISKSISTRKNTE